MTIPRIAPSRRRPFALLLVLASTAAPTHAADVDPLRSIDCRRAVASMQAEETAEAERRAGSVSTPSTPPAPSPALQDARRDAAKRCLASRLDVEPPHGRFAQAPIVVEPVGSPAPGPLAPNLHAPMPSTHPSTPSAALPTGKRPGSVVSCDPGGCWASDGSRLQRVGPVLWGPRGACTTQGASLQCP